MNILDTAKGKMRDLTDKANDLSGPAGEKLDSAKTAVAKGVDGTGKFVDEKTGGKYASTIHSSVGKVRRLLDRDSDQPPQPPQGPSS